MNRWRRRCQGVVPAAPLQGFSGRTPVSAIHSGGWEPKFSICWDQLGEPELLFQEVWPWAAIFSVGDPDLGLLFPRQQAMHTEMPGYELFLPLLSPLMSGFH